MRRPHSFAALRAILSWVSTNGGFFKVVLPLFIKNKKRLALMLAVVTALGFTATKLEDLLVDYSPEQLVQLYPPITGQA